MGMTDKKILELLDGYERKLSEMRDHHPSGEKWWGHRAVFRSEGTEKLEHTMEMIPKMRKFLEEGRREKVFRWLGFLQCVFWMLDIYTVEQLANHSRPTKYDLKQQYPGHSFDFWGCAPCSIPVGTQKSCKYAKEYTEAVEDPFPIT